MNLTRLKRIGTAFLTIVFLVGICAISPVSAKDLSDLAETNEDIELMVALGIYEGGKENVYDADAYISRLEFAGVLGRMFNLDASGARQVFDDLSAGAENAGYVSSAHGLGIFEGDGSGKFRPYDAIKYREAVKSLLYAAGYKEFIEAANDHDYVKALRKTGLSDGLKFGSDVPMTYGNMAELLLNAIEMPVVYSDVYSTNMDILYFETDPDRTVLTEFMKMYEYTGVVSADCFSNMDNSLSPECGEGHIMIDDILCEYDGGEDLLGMRVRAYIKEDDNVDRVMYCSASGENEIVQIGYREMEYSPEEIRYVPEKGKVEDYDLPDGVSVIYNGKFIGKTGTSYVTGDDFDIQSGYALLIDNDENGSIDVVRLTEYDTIYVAESYTAENVVVDYYQNETVEFEEPGVDYLFYHKGIECPMGRIRRNNVLSIAKSRDGKLVKVYMSDKSITGTISVVDEDGLVTIGDNSYVISQFYRDLLTGGNSQAAELDLGSTGIFYLNTDGEIAAYSNEGGSSYGYIVKMGFEGSLKNAAQVKMYTQSGLFEVYTMADKVALTDRGTETKLSGREVLDKLSVYDVIKFKLDSEKKIKEVELAVTSAQSQENTFTKHVHKAKLDYQLNVIGATYVVGTQTIVLNVPDPDNGHDVEDIMNYSTIPFFRTGVSYTVSIYDSDAYRTAGVIVNYCDNAGGPLTTAAAEPFVVEKVRHVNIDGESIPEIRGWQTDLEKSFYVEDLALEEDTANTSATAWVVGDFQAEDLRFGDVIQYNVAQNSYLNAFRVLFRPGTDTEYFEKVSSGYTVTPTTYRAGMYTAYAKVLRLNKTQFVYSTPDDGEKVVKFNAYTRVYVVDMQEETIRVAENTDLRPGDDVFFFLTQDRLYSMFIYRW